MWLFLAYSRVNVRLNHQNVRSESPSCTEKQSFNGTLRIYQILKSTTKSLTELNGPKAEGIIRSVTNGKSDGKIRNNRDRSDNGDKTSWQNPLHNWQIVKMIAASERSGTIHWDLQRVGVLEQQHVEKHFGGKVMKWGCMSSQFIQHWFRLHLFISKRKTGKGSLWATYDFARNIGENIRIGHASPITLVL